MSRSDRRGRAEPPGHQGPEPLGGAGSLGRRQGLGGQSRRVGQAAVVQIPAHLGQQADQVPPRPG